ncbi:P-loop containing nucleoside triphosphate hydrolase protein [Cylindrobasidium torrendii FP15055 ss-10]|uniref:p-loop containing nucleoside triphosphate hydrolase protein n=1 Tax=Cylindrobasidium torrendii FP15055 ss-10 TaxID=1314674 RepID=A0A0D7BJ08_9AGAR|nr:P-loop containing nucleoside triphosphate hydrolase protein [Cylindrobasidium torrendii FP15055 ss-10]
MQVQQPLSVPLWSLLIPSAPVAFNAESASSTRLYQEIRLIPAYVAAATAVYTIISSLTTYFRSSKKPAATGKARTYVQSVGGAVLVVCLFLRVLSSIALAVLTITAPTHPKVAIAECIVFLYTALLALKPSWHGRYNLVILSACAVYFYRDIFPFMTFDKSPMDGAQGGVLWAKIAVLAFIGVVLPLGEPRRYTPLDPDADYPASPEQTASIFSLAMHQYLDPLVWKAYGLPHLPADQLPILPDYDVARGLRTRVFPYLDQFQGAPKRHLFFGLMRAYFKDYVILFTCVCAHVVLTFISPIGLNRLLTYLETAGEGMSIRPWVWIASLFVGPFLASITIQWYIFVATRLIVVTQAILTQLTFEHALRIRVKASTESNKEAEKKDEDADTNIIGKITNLVTTDLENIVEARDFLFLVVYIPFQIALCIVFLYLIIGWSAFIGLACIIALLPAPGLVAKFTQTVQEGRLKKTDGRVQLVTEALNVLRMIKLFGWERRMEDKVGDKREEELTWIRRRQYLELTNAIVNFFIPLITMIATFGFYVCSSIVFSSMTVLDMLRDHLYTIFGVITATIAGKVSLDRMDKFLVETELLDTHTTASPDNVFIGVAPPEGKVGFNNATFTWSASALDDGSVTPSRRGFTLSIDHLVFQEGCINLVVGATGSGKTSLLMALLGEMHFIPTSADSWFSLPRERGVAYAAQESWVQNETIRDNILFGSPYDEARYKKVVHDCALERDFTLFEAGDKTEVGEKGLTLSGGQKARVTLARAMYSSAEIILLDDVLAALDVHTSKWIVDNCFSGELAIGRTIILVTHNIALTQPIASNIVSVKDGRIVATGAPALVRLPTEVKLELKQDEEHIKMADAAEEVDGPQPEGEPVKKDSNEKSGQLIMAEEIEEGHISWPALQLYFQSLGGGNVWMFFLAWLGGLSLTQVFAVAQKWWLGYWASISAEDTNVAYYISIYTLLGIGEFIAFSAAYFVYIRGSIRASKSIHARLVESVLGTTLRWLDKTPVSRIIARCTQDIRAVDGPVGQWFYWTVDLTIMLLFKLFAIVSSTPLFILPSLAVFIAGAAVGQVYIKAQLSVKREVSNAKAPVLGHFGAAIGGLASIRAYGAQMRFIDESLKRIDAYSRPNRTFFNLNRWVCIRVDALGGLFAAALAAYLVYVIGAEQASSTGFQLNMAIGFSGLILWWIRNLNEFEVQGNSLERIQHYLTIEQEQAPTAQGVPPAFWSASGKLVVEKLSARYSPDGPKVLHDVSFTIKSGERVGVVGRTGSGKSSLTLALLRCIPTEGAVWYDGMDTRDVNLEALRKGVTIIPQMPELLSGTLRQNLDPFDQYDDKTLNDALRASGLFALQEEQAENTDAQAEEKVKLTLDSSISSGGGNLSVGQRQIIALARAIVRQSKLLILDEATSAIDYRTDSIIQESLRKELDRDVTLITVAHRLQTIMDADKIMVLDAGRLVEFGAPRDLVATEGGRLRALVDESRDKDILIEMAMSEKK